MAKSRTDSATLDLFTWEPRVPAAPEGLDVPAEPKRDGRGLADRISLAVAEALRECDLPRDEVARRMKDFLGEPVPVHSLNGYASQGRPDHNISYARLVALAHATQRLDLLDLGAAALGARVVHARYVPAIESAIERDRAKELRRAAEEAERIADRKDRLWKGH